jgi:tetratricopeptide (TPR) repeat protein
MRPVLWTLLVFTLSLPLVFVLLLFPAATYPAMDVITMKTPMAIRGTVAELALKRAGYGKEAAKKLDRVLSLNPDDADAWSRRCQASDEASADPAACQKAVMLDPSAWNFNSLGTTEEHLKKYCEAEDSYTQAVKSSSNNAFFLRNMARAALRCGHPYSSIAGFEVAESLDAKTVADPNNDEDDLAEAKSDLATDREYLAVSYDQIKQPEKATVACTKVHTDWKICHCNLSDINVRCSGDSVVIAPKK